ncbi:hypothetical protein SAMN04490356_7698 [Streptomyces melanosporofaciens]|uniref:Uncharacterized protein n=2 Tax=Streptomyces TaxID=1883 RepID=A0A1H4ZAM3_STRMJ|nr:hypothetical protein SAMN04490356_7698 [Streptomyces melanosporofaciens]
MRMRRALVSLALGGALALGGTAVTAQAADGTASPQLSASETNAVPASWHFYRAYWTKAACLTEGDALGGTYTCSYGKGNDGKYKWFLYRWY